MCYAGWPAFVEIVGGLAGGSDPQGIPDPREHSNAANSYKKQHPGLLAVPH